MINVSSAMKRGPTEFKQDLEDIVEEDNIEKLLSWVQTEFKDLVKAFQGQKTSEISHAQNLEVKNSKPDEPQPSQKVEKTIIQGSEHKQETQKEKPAEKRVETPETQPTQRLQRESIKAEPLDSTNRVHSDYL